MKKTKRKIKLEIIFHLIKKMSKSDKRYFKLSNQSYNKKDKDFLKLFDYLNAQEPLDIVALEDFFNNKKLTSAINYLHTKILDILEEKAKKSPSGTQLYDENIEQHLNTCQVYLYAELLKFALIELHKAEEIAKRKKDYLYLIRIYGINQRILNKTHLNHYKYEELLLEANRKIKWALKQYSLMNEIGGYLIKNAQNSDVNSADYQESMRRIEEHLLHADELPDNLLHSIMNEKIRYHYQKKEYEKTAVLLEQAIEQGELIPYEKWDLSNYMAKWNNLLFISVDLDIGGKKADYFKKYVELPEKHPAIFKFSTQTIQKTYDIIRYNTEAMIILARREYEKIYKLEENLLNNVTDLLLLPKLTNVVEGTFLRIILVYLILENHERSGFWIEQYNKLFKAESPWKSLSEILTVMMHYDKGDYIYLGSKIRNLSRKWQKEKPEGFNVLFVLKLIQKALLKTKQNKIPEIWQAGLEKLYENEKTRVGYSLKLSRWVETKIQP